MGSWSGHTTRQQGIPNSRQLDGQLPTPTVLWNRQEAARPLPTPSHSPQHRTLRCLEAWGLRGLRPLSACHHLSMSLAGPGPPRWILSDTENPDLGLPSLPQTAPSRVGADSQDEDWAPVLEGQERPGALLKPPPPCDCAHPSRCWRTRAPAGNTVPPPAGPWWDTGTTPPPDPATPPSTTPQSCWSQGLTNRPTNLCDAQGRGPAHASSSWGLHSGRTCPWAAGATCARGQAGRAILTLDTAVAGIQVR